MTILVFGATGTIGSRVTLKLVAKGANVNAFVRSKAKVKVPDGVRLVEGDLMDVGSVRAALREIDTLFLLNAVTPDELTQALIALNLAREAGIERMVYFSVLHVDHYTNVPHFASKFAVERLIDSCGLKATKLRPAYFMNNDASLKDAILGRGVYPIPIGTVGVSMVEVDDIAEVAASEILRRERARGPLPSSVIDIVGPEPLSGPAVAAIWSEVLGRPVKYAGNDIFGFEEHYRSMAPGWMAYEMRLMMCRFQKDGMLGHPRDIDTLIALLGRPLRSYREFAIQTAKAWNAL